MSFPLVWVKTNKHEFAAHLLQTQDEKCQIRMMDGFKKWVPSHAVTHQLPPRPRRLPRKFQNYVNPEEEVMDGDDNIIVQDDDEEEEASSNRGSSDEEETFPAPVSVDDSEEEPKDLNLSVATEKTHSDEDTASTTSSSSLSSLTQSSHHQDNEQHDRTGTTLVTDTTLDSTDEESDTFLQDSSNQYYGTTAQASASSRPSVFSIRGALFRQTKTAPSNNSASSFSTLYAMRSLRGAVSNRVKSMFSWKRQKRTITVEESNNSEIVVGSKRSRKETTSSWNAMPVEEHSSTKKPRLTWTTFAKPNILIEEVIRRIAVEPFETVREGIEQRVQSGKSLNAFISLSDEDGSQRSMNAILSFASDRYDSKELCNKMKDASDTLKLLLDNGANPYITSKDAGQTPLHAAAASGCKCALAALLDQVEYSVDQLNILDSNGKTAFHAALSNGNYDCFELFMKKYSLETLLEKVLDKHGESVLASLIRNTDVPYDQNITAWTDESYTFQLFKKLLARIKEENRPKALIHKSKTGETIMAVAAICGCFHELKEISKLEFDCGRSTSNRCKIANGELKSPLDLARETKDLVEQGAKRQVFEERRINGIGDCRNPYRLDNWIESGVVPTIELLEELQAPVDLKTLRQLSRYQRGVSKLTPKQILTEKARDLQNKNAPTAAKNVYPPSIRCDIEDWKCINGSRSLLRAQILDMVRNPHTIPQVTPALIRDPKDPCIRSSTSTGTKHYGLFANDFIPKHTVVCEYSGLVRREDEGEYDPNPEYGVELSKCDEWAREEGGNYADAFILDAANVFNEASLINDVRDSVLEDDSEPEILRTENVMYVEVLINKWPRVFIITLQDIQAREELLIDYGASYWEKLSLSIMKEKLESANSKNAELEVHIASLREQLKGQEATWMG